MADRRKRLGDERRNERRQAASPSRDRARASENENTVTSRQLDPANAKTKLFHAGCCLIMFDTTYCNMVQYMCVRSSA